MRNGPLVSAGGILIAENLGIKLREIHEQVLVFKVSRLIGPRPDVEHVVWDGVSLAEVDEKASEVVAVVKVPDLHANAVYVKEIAQSSSEP